MSSYFIDSNIFLRFFAKETKSSVYRDCFKLIQNLKMGKLKAVTSNLVFAETVWVLTSVYKISKTDLNDVLGSLENIPSLKVIDNFQTNLANQLFKMHPVKYIDALIASNPNIYAKKWVVISYDRDFDKLGVIRKEPSKII